MKLEILNNNGNTKKYICSLTKELDNLSGLSKEGNTDIFRHYILADEGCRKRNCFPIRVPGGTVGNIVFDEDNVLYVGHTTGKKVNLMDVCPPYDVSHSNYYSTNSFNMAGKSYEGFSMEFGSGEYVLVNLEGKYSNLMFDFGHVDGESKYDCTLNIYLDDKLEKTIEQRADADVSHIKIPLNYSKHLKLEFCSSVWTRYGLGNIKLKY